MTQDTSNAESAVTAHVVLCPHCRQELDTVRAGTQGPFLITWHASPTCNRLLSIQIAGPLTRNNEGENAHAH